MKYIIRGLSVFLIVAMLLGSLVGCTSQRKPLIYVKSAIERSFEKSLGGEIASLLTEVFSAGSVSASFQGDGAPGGVTAVTAALYFDAAQHKVASNTAIVCGDHTFDAKLWLSGDHVILASNAFLGSTTLGVDLKTLEADLEHSIFRNNSGTAYAVPEISEGTADAVLTLVEGFFSLYTAADDLSALLDKHAESFLRYLTDHARYTRYSEGGRVYVHLEVDNSALSRALRDTWTKATGDKKLCRRLREVAKTRDAMQSAAEGVVSTAWTNVVENWIVNSAEIEALCAKIDAADPFVFELNASVKKLTGTLLTLDAAYRSGETEISTSLDLTKKDALHFTLLFGGVTRDFTLNTVKDSFSTYEATFAYLQTNANGENRTWQGSVALDKKQDSYVLNLTQGDRTRSISGEFRCDKKGVSLSVDRVTEGEQKLNFSCFFAIKPKEELPAAPQYVNLPTVAEQRIDPVATRVKETREAFHAAFDEEAFTYHGVINCLLLPFCFE